MVWMHFHLNKVNLSAAAEKGHVFTFSAFLTLPPTSICLHDSTPPPELKLVQGLADPSRRLIESFLILYFFLPCFFTSRL